MTADPIPITSVMVRRENDILLARQACRQISQYLGFTQGDCTRITTALSEIARNAFEYGGGGTITFSIDETTLERQGLLITVADSGRGIADVAAVLAPEFKSSTGMGVGITGSRALMDHFSIVSAPGVGTTVTMIKALPRNANRFVSADAIRLARELSKASQTTPIGELQVQNQALLHALQDVTQRQTEIDRLRGIADEAQRIAARSLLVRQRFMALTTHEFRTPLNAIIGYLDLLDLELSETLTPAQVGYFARLKAATKHLATLTNDFLDMAQDDAGRLVVERRSYLAHNVMREAFTFVAPQAAARNVTLRLVQRTEGISYLGDVSRVRQILINILGNAVSFTPPNGVVELIVERIPEPSPQTALAGGPWCVLRVNDTGPGIPDDKLPYVFEPFVQVSTDGQSTRRGSGLGLTVSRQLALLMGGDLTAASSGAGAAFTLWLAEAEDKAPATDIVAAGAVAQLAS